MTNQIPVSKLKKSQWLLNVIIQKAILTKRLWSNKFTTSSGHHSLPSKYNQLSLGGQMMISAVAEIHAFIRTASMFTSYKMHTIKLKTSPAPQIEGFQLHGMGSRSKSAKTNKHEKEEPERKTDADEYFLSFQTTYISNHSAKNRQWTDCYCFTDQLFSLLFPKRHPGKLCLVNIDTCKPSWLMLLALQLSSICCLRILSNVFWDSCSPSIVNCKKCYPEANPKATWPQRSLW